jgi:signal peptidase I
VIDFGRARSRYLALAAVAAASVLWLALAPTQLGGPTSFASISGRSMEPGLRQGDLVVLRRADDYRVGDVVAYRSAVLHRTVLHRIVAIRDGHYTFRGDNNRFRDPGTATRGELVGREWIRLPLLGRLASALHAPWLVALLLAAAVTLLGFRAGPRRLGARARRAAAPRLPARLEPLLGTTATVAAAAAAGYLLLLVVALVLPSHEAVRVDGLYGYRGSFAYGATAPVSAAYPDGRVRSGDTVFTQLVDAVRFRYSWRLRADGPHAVRGTVALAAIVSDGSGWSRRLTLAPPAAFSGDAATVGGNLRLGSVRDLVSRFERETGTHLGQYRVRVVPRVALEGVVGGRPVTDVYEPKLDLALGSQALQLASSDGRAPALEQTHEVAGVVSGTNRLSLGPFGISVLAARVLGAVGGLLALLVLAAARTAGRRYGTSDPIERQVARSGLSVVRVEDERRAARLVDVRYLDGLLRIARRYDRLLLYAERTGAYLVQDDDVVYRWRPQPERGPATERRDLRTRPWGDRPAEGAAADAA